MRNKTTLLKRILSVFMILSLLAMTLPGVVQKAEAATTDTRVVDPSTMDDWKNYFGPDVMNTENAGGVWVDKSVFKDAEAFNNIITMDDASNNFLVALSAIASNKSITGYAHIPTDTMLILDVSGSMQGDKASNIVAAANDAIVKLQETNKNNRVGVVLYSGNSQTGNSSTGTATVLLPLDRYTQYYETQQGGRPGRPDTVVVKDEFITISGNTISINDGVENSQGTELDSDKSKSVEGGTYIQNGIDMAMKELLAVTDTTVEGDGFQAGTKRMPIMVLMSDGAPTAATNRYDNIGTSNMGDGTTDSATAEVAFVTQLTAAYAKAKVEEHYDCSSLFYTLGVGVGGDNIAKSVLNPEESIETIDNYWTTYVGLREKGQMILQNYGNSRAVSKNSLIADSTAQYYVDEYFSATGASDMNDAFAAIIQEIIIQSLYYPTLVENGNQNMGGYIEFIDDIGQYMEVKSIKGILLGDTLYTGEKLALNFTEGGGELGTVTNPNDLGKEMIKAVQQRLGVADTVEAQELVINAWKKGQLSYDENTGEFSNYIGWYADENGKYISFGFDGDTNIPSNAIFYNKSYGMLGDVKDGHKDSDMMYVSIQVHTRIATGTSAVIFKVPASLVPVVSYNISLEGDSIDNAENIEIECDSAEPIRLVYEVGLNADINEINITDVVADDYKYKNNDGTYTFYTNRWNVEDFENAPHPSQAMNTVAFFEPSVENERYYYNENSFVYIKDGDIYRKYEGAAAPGGQHFYREYVVFRQVASDGAAVIERKYELISNTSLSNAVKSDDDNTWYIPKGVIHRMLDEYAITKGTVTNGIAENNFTGTLIYSNYPTIEYSETHYFADAVLGNNGKFTMAPAQGIKLSKSVDETLAGRDDTFAFTINRTDTLDDNGVYRVIRVNASGKENEAEIAFTDSRATVELKANEMIYILDLPEGAVYTISEDTDDKDYEVISVNGDTNITEASISIAEYVISNAAFVNTFDAEGNLIIKKTVEHPFGTNYQIPEEMKFAFEVQLAGCYDTSFETSTGTNVVTDSTGRFTVYLKPSETIAIYGIQEGVEATITEINIPNGFTCAEEVLSGTITNAENTILEFVNTYVPEKVTPVNVTVEGVKNLTGREWLPDDEFTFELQRRDGNTWTTIGTQTVTDETEGYKFDFSEQIQSEEYTAIDVYAYRVIEAAGSIGGVTYDTTVRYFDITVTDNDMNGYLEIEKVTGYDRTTVVQNEETGNWAVAVDFNNRYAPAGSTDININVNKVVEDYAGTEYSPSGFKFGLYQGEECIVESNETSEAGEAVINLVFDASSVGQDIQYVLKEIVPETAVPGMAYSTNEITLKIEVIDNLDGTVSAIVYDVTVGQAEATDTITETFTNIYDPEDAKATISGTKALTGRDLNEGEFTFLLYETDNDFAVTTDTEPLQTVNNSADGSFSFEEIGYDMVGEYYYVVAEKAGELGGVIYDTTLYQVIVNVTDGGEGALVADVYVSDGINEDVEIKFNNEYKPEDTSITLGGMKLLEGRELKAEEFSFKLYNATEDYEIDGVVLQTAKNEADGTFTFDTITINEVGIYRYIIVEDDTEALARVTYDDSVYVAVVVVYDDGEGSLIASEPEVGNLNGDTPEAGVVFENTYTPKPRDIGIDITVKKAVKNIGDLEIGPEDFEFVLENQTTGVKTSVKTDKEGLATFTLGFTEADIDKTYTYKLSEVNDGREDVTYSEAVYTIEVMVTLDSNNNLIATVTNNDIPVDKVIAEFENIYDGDVPEPPSVPNIPDTPVTGDNNNALFWGLMFLLSGIMLISLTAYERKARKI